MKIVGAIHVVVPSATSTYWIAHNLKFLTELTDHDFDSHNVACSSELTGGVFRLLLP